MILEVLHTQNVGYIKRKKKSLEGCKKMNCMYNIKKKINFDLSSFINAKIICKYYFWHLKYDKLQTDILKGKWCLLFGEERKKKRERKREEEKGC